MDEKQCEGSSDGTGIFSECGLFTGAGIQPSDESLVAYDPEHCLREESSVVGTEIPPSAEELGYDTIRGLVGRFNGMNKLDEMTGERGRLHTAMNGIAISDVI